MTTNNSINVPFSGSTGSGMFVGSTSGTLTTPKIAQINDSNGNAILDFQTVSSAVNNINVVNNATGQDPGFTALGSDTNINIALLPKGSGSVKMIGPAIATSISFTSTTGIIGTTTNNNAAAGSVGEAIFGQVLAASAITLTSTVLANLITLSLTSGDWDIYGNAFFFNAGTLSAVVASISLSSATNPDQSLIGAINPFTALMTNTGLTAPTQRISLATTTNVYLVVDAVFATGSTTCCGTMLARRAR